MSSQETSQVGGGGPVNAGVARNELHDGLCIMMRSLQHSAPPGFLFYNRPPRRLMNLLKQGVRSRAPILSQSWLRQWGLDNVVCVSEAASEMGSSTPHRRREASDNVGERF